jgi:cytochrome c-type biogenesis protein CcmH/NrfG
MPAYETERDVPRGWKTIQVYAMGLMCLAIGMTLGYLFRGSESAKVQPQAAQLPAGSPRGAPPPMPGLDDMKRMADKQAEPLLAKLKRDPNNSDLLNQIGLIYKATHQFNDAIAYYQRALQANPKNTAARTDLASCLYYLGDTDGALKQLQESLTYSPKDVNSLFNLGMIRWQGKKDGQGALAAWSELLKVNPELEQTKKAQVEKLIAQVRQPSQID